MKCILSEPEHYPQAKSKTCERTRKIPVLASNRLTFKYLVDAACQMVSQILYLTDMNMQPYLMIPVSHARGGEADGARRAGGVGLMAHSPS